MADEQRRSWRLPLGVRGRTALAATAVVAVALAAASLVTIELQRRDLTSNVENATRLRADDVAAFLEGGALPSTLSVRRADEAFIQILDPQGRVVAASANVSSLPPLAATRSAGEIDVQRLDALEPIDDDPFVLVSRAAVAADGVHTVTS